MERWLPFTAWLRQQASDREGRERTDFSGSGPAPSADQHSVQPSLPRRRPGIVQPNIPDCSREQRLLEGYAAGGRARQEMSVVLAVPGLPAHCAPVLTAKQATALLRAISEPLLSLEAGRLTRRLSSPAKLVPTEERGLLTLWLLPNDDLTLCWQSVQPVGPSRQQQHPADQQGTTAAATVVVCEALAHFPACSFFESDDPVAVIHTLRNDASGRSFYVRPRADIAPLSTEQAVDQMQQASTPGEAVALALPVGDPSTPRLYFWLRGRDLQGAVQGLGRLKSLLRRPPTLAKRSGVPQKKLDEIASWLSRVEAAAAQQPLPAQQQTPIAQPAATAGEGSSSTARETVSPSEGLAGALCCTPPRQQHLPSGSPAAGPAPPPAPKAASLLPSVLLGKGAASPALASARMAAAVSTIAASSQGMAMPGLQGGAALPPAVRGLVAQQGASGNTPPPTASSTVSASASAVYHDRRFNLLAPVAVAVVVTCVLQGEQGGASTSVAAAEQQQPSTEGLQAEAQQHASVLAQEHAQAALERSGRRLMEEQLAEAVISSIRAGRAAAGGSSRQRAQHKRARQEAEERRWRTALAMPKIRAAAIAASRRGKLQSGQPQLQQPVAVAPVTASPTAPVLPSPVPTSPCTPCRGDAASVPASGEGMPSVAAVQRASASALAAPIDPRSRAAAPLAAAENPAGARVTLSNLEEVLLGGASATATPDSRCKVGRQHKQQRSVTGEAGSASKGEELETGLADSGVGTPGKVTLGGLFKLLNGCLDM